MRAISFLAFLALTGSAFAQLSPKEAEKRLHERQALHSPTTQPIAKATNAMLLAQVEALQKELAALKAENTRLRQAAGNAAAPKNAVDPNQAIDGFSAAAAMIPAEMMHKRMADETDLDQSERAAWVENNLTGQSISLTDGVLKSLRTDDEGYVLSMTGYQKGQGRIPVEYFVQCCFPTQAKAKLLALNNGDRISVRGRIREISIERSMVNLPPDRVHDLIGVIVTARIEDAELVSSERGD